MKRTLDRLVILKKLACSAYATCTVQIVVTDA